MDKELQDPLPASRSVVSANEEAQAVPTISQLPVTGKGTAPVSLRCSRQTSGQDLPLTTGEDVVVHSLRRSTDESYGREAHDDGEIVTELGQPHILSTACSPQVDGPELPVLSGDEVDNTQLREKGRSIDEQEVPIVLAGAVPVEEGLPTMVTGHHESHDNQELPLPTREDPVSIGLRGVEDYDGGLETRTSSEDGGADSEEDELHASPSGCDQGTDEAELSARAEDQIVIACVHESGSTAAVLEETVSANEQLWAMSCRCSDPIREEELRLPEEERGNVITCLLRNGYNCSVEKAQARLKSDNEWRAVQWEETAGIGAAVELEQRRVGIVYADEKAMDDVKLEVPRQVKYVGTSPAIPPSLADTPCVDLGVDGMLQYLNCLLRTTYTLDEPGLSSVLQSYIDRGFDFGLAYGHLRHFWLEFFTQLPEMMREWEAKDKARRDRAVHGAYIVDRWLPPRRAWDLYSNRVLPWWVFREWNSYSRKWTEMDVVDAVSHSWVHDDDRQSVRAAINGRKWPVPIPKDVSLDRVRVELLNVGREVVWLDVLCLWQDGVTADDAVRLHEWELDVPTIGGVYQSLFSNTVVTYFNGLGRPFRIDNLDDERHWLSRAWTLQEFDKVGIIGGLVPGSFPPPMVNNQVNSDLNVIRFYHRLQAASDNYFGQSNVVLSVLAAMGPRHAAHVVDKVGGITHILTLDRIPKYIRGNESSAAEDAWNLLIPVMRDSQRADLFFLYPGRGNGKYAWCPSWEQVNGPLPPVPLFTLRGSLKYYKVDGRFECPGWLIEKCQIRGFTKPNPGGRCRTGTLRVVHDGAEHSFTVAARHQVPILDGSYALVGDRSEADPDVVVWAVGTLSSHKRFEKLSVLRTEDKNDIETMQNLGLINKWRLFDPSKSSIALV